MERVLKQEEQYPDFPCELVLLALGKHGHFDWAQTPPSCKLYAGQPYQTSIRSRKKCPRAADYFYINIVTNLFAFHSHYISSFFNEIMVKTAIIRYASAHKEFFYSTLPLPDFMLSNLLANSNFLHHREHNLRFANSRNEAGLVCVFAGATSGIGASTLEKVVTMLEAPTFYVIGRSATRFATQSHHLQSLNPNAKIVFLEAEISLLSDVDVVCKQIAAKEKKVDYLYMSPGLMPLNGPQCSFSHSSVKVR